MKNTLNIATYFSRIYEYICSKTYIKLKRVQTYVKGRWKELAGNESGVRDKTEKNKTREGTLPPME